MRRSLALWGAVLALAVASAAALVRANDLHFADSPPTSMTGAPAIGAIGAESDCTLCHQDYSNPCSPLPCNLNTPGGGVEILDLPADYLPGSAIPLRVRLWTDSTLSSPTREWGFQITSVRESDGAGAGTWIVPDPDTLHTLMGSAPFDTRSYLQQSRPGIRPGLAGPIEWSFSWMPPGGNEGKVIFCLAGNAANGNNEPGGSDFVFTFTDTIGPSAVSARSIRWGALKAKYR